MNIFFVSTTTTHNVNGRKVWPFTTLPRAEAFVKQWINDPNCNVQYIKEPATESCEFLQSWTLKAQGLTIEGAITITEHECNPIYG